MLPGSEFNYSKIKLPSGLFPDEFRSLLSQLPDEPFRTIAIASGCLGLRGVEVVALRWGDFSADFSTLTLHYNKAAFHATLPVCPRLIEVFTEFKSRSPFTLDGDWVFAMRHDPRFHLHRMRVLERINAAGKSACLRPLYWHSLRWTLGNTLITLGFDFWTVGQLMRCANVESMLLFFNGQRFTTGRIVLTSAAELSDLRAAATQATHALLSNTEKEGHQC
jgi:integrase